MNINNKNESKNGKFKLDIKLPPPGKCKDRISLRPGLVKFSEGITLSYAERSDGINDYSPFTPFAYLTDTSKEKPFILYYDPKMKNRRINQGPIVIHGGFTSAFYDFSFDGTGRLVTSIACWLIRYEERLYRQIQNDMKTKMVKNIPAINIPYYTGEKFTKWIVSSPTLYSIIVLDVSGSMESYYQSLINMTNGIINNQMKNPSNKGTIIFFGNEARAMVYGNYKTLTTNDIRIANVGGGTDFYRAFSEATKNQYINYPGNFDDKRLLFLTDGESSINGLSSLCDIIHNAGFSIHILGFGNYNTFYKLKQFVRGNGTFQTYFNFEDVASSAEKIFAADINNIASYKFSQI